MEPHAFTNLGGKERAVDTRDYNLGSTSVPVPASYPAVYMQDNAWKANMYYQGKQPACGAHAGTWFNALLNSYSGTTPNYSPRFMWIDLKQHDGYSIDDGTDMRSIFQSLQTAGSDDFLPLRNDVSLDEKTYASTTAVTDAEKSLAKTNVVSHYAFGDKPSFDGLKQLIYQNRGVVLLLRVGAEFWTAPNGVTSWAEKDVLPLRTPTTQLSGHFVCAHSYDENYIYFANSFSTSWGRNGHGYFGANYMPYVLEAGTATTVAPWVAANLTKQISLAQQVLSLLKQLLKIH